MVKQQQVTLDTAVNKLVQEVVRHLMENSQTRTVPTDTRKVLHRSAHFLHTEDRPDDAWQKNRERTFRQAEMGGFFSSAWESYRELGEGGFELDTRRLVLDHLVPALDLLDDQTKPTKVHNTPINRPPGKKENVVKGQIMFPTDMDEVTGIKAIRLALRFAQDLYKAVKGKQTFPIALWELRKMSQKPNDTEGSSSMRNRMLAIPLDDDGDPNQKEKEYQTKSRCTHFFLEKIKAIQHIMNTLYNMKDRDLRHKTPLSRNTIQCYRYSRKLNFESVDPIPQLTDPLRFRKEKAETQMKLNDILVTLRRNPPLWQNVLSVAAQQHCIKSKLMKEIPPQEMLFYLHSNFFKVLKRTKQRYLHHLERLERELVPRYKYTFLALSILPLYLMHYKQMYEAAQVFQDKESRAVAAGKESSSCNDFKFYMLEDPTESFEDILKQESEPLHRTYKEGSGVAVWYQLLEEETWRLNIHDVESVQAQLKQMVKFHASDLKSLHNPQEKLCLLLMSLPLTEICTRYWQDAAKFVFEEILEGTEGTIELWLEKRGLPILT